MKLPIETTTTLKKNTLYYGNCLDVMCQLPNDSVDLIYLDPPFNSNRTYNAIYKDETGRELPDQVEAFCDVWTLDAEREEQIRQFKRNSETTGMVGQMLDLWSRSLRPTNPKLLAYLFYMAERLLAMKKLLKPTGSVYFHCDPTTSHYVKPFMDAIFGYKNFRNEIIWHYRRWSAAAKQFQRMHDVIFWYSRGEEYTFTKPLQDYSNPNYIETTVRGVVDGKLTRLKDEHGQYIQRDKENKGVLMHDVWNDINFIAPTSKERMGYPTQKPLALLERIIKASSNEGDVVLDPFCGCATTIEAAQNLNRRWIGIDIAFHAIKRVSRVRLQEKCRLIEGNDYVIDGIPRTLEGARDLWNRDKYQFQKWAIEQVGGFVTARKTADGGIDGRIYFRDSRKNKHLSMVLEVKGGRNVSIKDVRDLRGVMEREYDSVMAGLIVLDDLSERKKANFLREMATAGTHNDGSRQCPKMQLLSVNDILAGKVFDTLHPYSQKRGEKQQVLKGLNQ